MSDKHNDGDTIDHVASGAISAGDAVALTADDTVAALATSNGYPYGIALHDAANGEELTVALRGVWEVKVATGTLAGVYLTGSATAGELRERVTSGTGEEAPHNTAVMALEDEALGFAPVTIR